MTSARREYLSIVRHYEACLKKHGDNHLGVDWPNEKDAALRYAIMLDIVDRPRKGRVSLLDFGCGASHLFGFIKAKNLDFIEYAGLDLSERFVALSRKKYPMNVYFHADILREERRLPTFDYVVLNGVFTEKRGLPFSRMFRHMEQVLTRVWAIVRIGMAFNVMSTHVDWKRSDLFHVPYDRMASFLRAGISRHFAFRSDYGLYEYTVYVYRKPHTSNSR